MENMIYTCDISSKNTFLYYNIFDEENELDMNYYKGSFLKKEFDSHMKNVWKIEKFDIIVGNPPYNDGKKRHFYRNFFDKSFDILKNKSYFVFVTPSRYVLQPEFKKLRTRIEDISTDVYLKNVGRIFDTVSFTTVITYIKIEENDKKLNVNWVKGIGNSIVEKILNKDIKKLNTQRTKSIFKNNTDRDSFPDEVSNDFYWKYFVNSKGKNKSSTFRFLEEKITDTFKPKIAATEFVGTGKTKTLGKPLIDYNGDWGVGSDSVMVIYSDDNKKLDQLYNYFTSKLMKYLLTLICQSSHANQTMRLIPDITEEIQITDNNMYNYFNLSQDEIDLIEKTIK